MENVKILENGLEAKKAIEELTMQGFEKDDIYLFTHNKKLSEDLADSMNISNVGVAEQGFFGSIANAFRTRGDELRSKFESLGLSTAKAEHYEEELDQGRYVVIAIK